MATKTARRGTASPVTQRNDIVLSDRWSWTVNDFQRAYDLGVFGYDAQLELIEGEIIRKMPQNEPHAWAIQAVTEALRAVYAADHSVRVQLPLVLSPHNKPEPDVAVVTGSFNDYKRTHPATAVLAVEISDSTLERDRTTKASVYSRAGISEYWIINLPDRVLEVYRDPAAMPSQPLGHHYRSITRYMEGDTVSPLSVPDAALIVADLLP